MSVALLSRRPSDGHPPAPLRRQALSRPGRGGTPSPRALGAPLAELAERFGVAKSSVSAITKYKAHEIPGTLRVALPKPIFELLTEIAEDKEIPVERLAADLVVGALRSRAW